MRRWPKGVSPGPRHVLLPGGPTLAAAEPLNLPFHYRPHMSRRGFATTLKALGEDAVNIAGAGQWESPRSVEVYIQDDLNRTRVTLSKLRGKIHGKTKKVV